MSLDIRQTTQLILGIAYAVPFHLGLHFHKVTEAVQHKTHAEICHLATIPMRHLYMFVIETLQRTGFLQQLSYFQRPFVFLFRQHRTPQAC